MKPDHCNPVNKLSLSQGMKSIVVVVLLLCLAPVLVLAEGEVFPFDRDKGRMIVPHERLELTDAQQREAVARHRITLTPAQHERLRAVCPTFPKTIREILPYNWGDCTCLVGHPYAILLPGGRSAAIPREEFGLMTQFGVSPSSMPKPPSAWTRFWSRLLGRKSA